MKKTAEKSAEIRGNEEDGPSGNETRGKELSRDFQHPFFGLHEEERKMEKSGRCDGAGVKH